MSPTYYRSATDGQTAPVDDGLVNMNTESEELVRARGTVTACLLGLPVWMALVGIFVLAT